MPNEVSIKFIYTGEIYGIIPDISR